MPTDWNRWHKSTHSGGGNDCLEARLLPGTRVTAIAEVRDTKDRAGGSLTVGETAWKSFLARIA